MLTRVADEQMLYVPQMEPIRRDLLQDALTFYQKFLADKSDDPVIRREAARAYRRVGSIHHQFCQYPEAEKAHRKAIAILAELGATSILEPALRLEQVGIHIELSWTLGWLRKVEEFSQEVRRAVQVAEKLVEEFPDSSENRIALFNAHNVLAGMLTTSQPEEALKILRRNLPLADDAFCLEGIHRLLDACWWQHWTFRRRSPRFASP